MKIVTECYIDSKQRLPESGQHILANQTINEIVVYQAYNADIADFAVKNQRLGGPAFSINRMSWIKPNFLWMMFRCGWAEKENQERVLAITISKMAFEKILTQAVFSSYDPSQYLSHKQWKMELNLKEVRLQWDPDHDPFGNKLDRRAIQLGLKLSALRSFIEDILSIEDITDFVKQQNVVLENNGLEKLLIPVETIFQPSDNKINHSIGLST